ncbi:coenzyme F390 synthetase-like protein [Fulvivirga imtechensis AK7]|uniref:Coenzyme F390 synthetase-like protein n=2 Tax=Fulvivirga TaxID=396811 RepID=L8JVP2_9BACT|nr:coenzyme F390 synthetase-like protein [Fulvivirga imtechensis AK7]
MEKTIPPIEKASYVEIETYQLNELRKVLHYVIGHSAFYKEHFKRNNISPDTIQRLSDLQKIPPVSKHDLQKHQKDFWCAPTDRIIEYTNTSGTEGEALTVPMTESDLKRLAYNEALSLACAGGSSKEIYQLTTTVDRRFMAGLAYILGARELGAGMVRVGPGIPQLQWKTIAEIQPTALIAVPSFLLKLIDYAESNDIDYKNGSVKKVICIGESIRNSDFSYNALGQRIKEKWDIPLYSTYASTEMATAFTECDAGRGGHLHPELIIAEILDDEGNPVVAGVEGELTITTLGIEGLPLVRFRTGDICAMHTEPCSCGRNTARLGPIVGRKHQMIKYKGTTCYPPAIFEVLDSLEEIIYYQVEIYSNEYGGDEVMVRYNAQESLFEKALTDRFRASLRVTPKLERISQETILSLVFPGTSRKAVKLVDRRSQLVIK